MVLWYWHECEPPQLEEVPPPYGITADVWSLGMCLYVMLCGCFPFDPSQSEEELMRAINAAEFQYEDPGWKRSSEAALDLVKSLLTRDPADRLVIEEVLQHPFCAEAVAQAFELERRAALKEDALDAALDALDVEDDAE